MCNSKFKKHEKKDFSFPSSDFVVSLIVYLIGLSHSGQIVLVGCVYSSQCPLFTQLKKSITEEKTSVTYKACGVFRDHCRVKCLVAQLLFQKVDYVFLQVHLNFFLYIHYVHIKTPRFLIQFIYPFTGCPALVVLAQFFITLQCTFHLNMGNIVFKYNILLCSRFSILIQ